MHHIHFDLLHQIKKTSLGVEQRQICQIMKVCFFLGTLHRVWERKKVKLFMEEVVDCVSMMLRSRTRGAMESRYLKKNILLNFNVFVIYPDRIDQNRVV